MSVYAFSVNTQIYEKMTQNRTRKLQLSPNRIHLSKIQTDSKYVSK